MHGPLVLRILGDVKEAREVDENTEERLHPNWERVTLQRPCAKSKAQSAGFLGRSSTV